MVLIILNFVVQIINVLVVIICILVVKDHYEHPKFTMLIVVSIVSL